MAKVRSNITLGDVLEGETYEVDQFNSEGATIVDSADEYFQLFDGEYEVIEE